MFLCFQNSCCDWRKVDLAGRLKVSDVCVGLETAPCFDCFNCP